MATDDRIGPYRVTGLLGTGGMGDVFRAVRDDDQYRAEVAIKVMRADVRNPRAEQRFRSERQILAGLDHRNIARLLDGGATTSGLPYVVMELVDGEPIDRYCESHNLPVRERVRLFLQACAAVTYAHQHLVVHRDLKPNNIFVAADGSVKLLDFGIAKLIEPDTETVPPSDATVTQLRAMTLDYASPEQLSGGLVTTVSDVYSLGVVLYGLVTGHSPYGARTSDAQRVAEILSDTQPTRPSQAVKDTATAGTIDADFDHILLMALRKEPAKRYGSVEQFAADLRNYLDGNPVLARRGTLTYRASKFVRRNKAPIAAGVIIVAALAGGLAFYLREAHIANEQRVIAQRHFDSVRKLANKLFDFHDEIAELPGATKARENLVTTSLEYLDALYQESGDDPTLREELGSAYRRVGAIQNVGSRANTGDTAGARRSLERAVALLEPLVATDPKNSRAVVSLAHTYQQLTMNILNRDGTRPALALGQKTIDLLESHREAFTDEFQLLAFQSEVYQTQADIVSTLEDGAMAASALREKMLKAAEEYHQKHPDERRARIALESVLNNSGIALDARLPLREAMTRSVTMLRRALAIDEALLAEQPNDPGRTASIGQTHFNIGHKLIQVDDYGGALAELKLAEPELTKAASEKENARAAFNLVLIQTRMAFALGRTGKPRESLQLLASADPIMSEMRRKDTEALHLKFEQTTIDIFRGDAFAQLAQWKQARESSLRGIEELRRINEIYPLVGEDRFTWDIAIANVAKADAEIAKASR